MSPTTKEFVEKFGEQAYQTAIEFASMAAELNDGIGVDLFINCAKEIAKEEKCPEILQKPKLMLE